MGAEWIAIADRDGLRSNAFVPLFVCPLLLGAIGVAVLAKKSEQGVCVCVPPISSGGDAGRRRANLFSRFFTLVTEQQPPEAERASLQNGQTGQAEPAYRTDSSRRKARL